MDDPRRLLAALARRWTPDHSLVAGLPADAVVAWIAAAAERGDHGAVLAAVPRLLTLAVEDDVAPLQPAEALAVLHRAGWAAWPAAERDAVVAVLDGWWRATLVGHPSRPSAHDVLVAQARLRGEVRPLLDTWLDELDGSGAVHLAEVVRDHLPAAAHRLIGPAWDAMDDLAGQVAAWARSDAVVVGLTVVGGSHLDHDLLATALDRLI